MKITGGLKALQKHFDYECEYNFTECIKCKLQIYKKPKKKDLCQACTLVVK